MVRHPERAAHGGRIEPRTRGQRTPALGVGLRATGAAGGESHQHPIIIVRHEIREGLADGGARAPATDIVIGDPQVVGMRRDHFRERTLAVRRRHELRAVRVNGGNERQQEGLTLLAEVQQVLAGWQLPRDRRGLAEELRARERRTVAPQEHAVRMGRAQHRPPLTAITWRVT